LSDPTAPVSEVLPVTIEEEMKRSYLDYAMSVIVSRALPDVRDGLKPVHRRILYTMHEHGYTADKPHRKSARIVGDVMGKYHPHGGEAIYDAMVRMVQSFAMRLPLLDGQGNFGSMDGDPPAAMRYTEIRLADSADALLSDIDKETVDFQPNYDDSGREPTVLPAMFPNLLVNGAGGIAVGMATNIAPHNLGEVIDACCAYIDNPNIDTEGLMAFVLGPDFPTGGIILGRSGIRSGFHLGRGSVAMRGRVVFEKAAKDRDVIVITEIPYQVNKAAMIERIAEGVRDKRIEGISELRDESDRDGVRVVVETKRDADPNVVLNQLYRFTPLQTSFGINMLALNGGKPELLGLQKIIAAFVVFREEVILRRTRFLLGKARDRAHVLVGLAVAVANIDAIVAIVRGARDPAAARLALMERRWPAQAVADMIALIDEPRHKVTDGFFRLSETQARAILDLRLQRLTGLGREEIAAELGGLAKQINEFLEILGSRERLSDVLRQELLEVKRKFANPRRTEIVELEHEQDDEALIQREDMVVTVTLAGYVKRSPLSIYRPQQRGGKGRSGMATREADFVTQVFVASTHTPVLFFSNHGRVYKLKVHRLPLGPPNARGKALINLLPLAEGERIAAVMPLPEDEASWGKLAVMFATARGDTRRNSLNDFVDVRAGGKLAMRFEGEGEGDRLIAVLPCGDDDDVLLASRMGKCVRFPVDDVRVFQSRSSTGVRGMKLAKGDEVISMSILRHIEATTEEREAYLKYAAAQRRITEGEKDVRLPIGAAPSRYAELAAAEQFILTVTERGFGKRSSAYDYRITSRGGLGIINIITNPRNGRVVDAFPVSDTDHIVLVTNGGQIIRCPVNDIRVAGRDTQGVTLFKLAEGEHVVSVARLSEAAGVGDGDGEAIPGAAPGSELGPTGDEEG
jgi:DNA gyrase subunit A